MKPFVVWSHRECKHEPFQVEIIMTAKETEQILKSNRLWKKDLWGIYCNTGECLITNETRLTGVSTNDWNKIDSITGTDKEELNK